MLKASGELSPHDRAYRLARADDLHLSVGDVVRVRQNLWSRTDPERSLLNGNRGIVTDIRRDGSVLVAWRSNVDAEMRDSVVSAAEISLGALSHGYAITDHAAQGQTADIAFVYPVGMDANAAYPAVTRHRDELHLFIALDQVEDDIARKRLGPVASDAERVVRGVEALARSIQVRIEEMVSLELELDLATVRSAPAQQAQANEVMQRLEAVGRGTSPGDQSRSASADNDLRQILDATANFYAGQSSAPWVKPYLADRGLRPDDLPEGAGYAPAGWRALVQHLRAAGFSDESMLSAGVVARSSRGELIDRMRDRLVLPIRDEVGPVAFIGRVAASADGPKWLNTVETDLFSKGALLYGLADHADALRAGATPVLVEGPLDVAAINAAGEGRFVGLAPLGTALTSRHIDALAAMVVLRERDVVVGFDADQAGQSAALRAYDLLAGRTDGARRLALPDGTDPADFLAMKGPAALHAALDNAGPLVEAVIEARIARWVHQLQFAEGRIGALRDVAGLIAGLPPTQVPGQVARVMQRLDLPHDIVVETVVEAIPTFLATRPSPATKEPRLREHLDAERLRALKASRPTVKPEAPRPGLGI
jgi:DNA primase catalytic core